MRLLRHAICIAVALFIAGTTDAKIHRSASAIAAFKREQVCPSTGKARGKCPGYIVDHVIPLCAGGADAPSNMQWQTIAGAKDKDKIEIRECRTIQKH